MASTESRTLAATVALLATVIGAALASPASAFRVEIVNNSGKSANDVYLMLHNGSSSGGQLPAEVPKRLSSLNNSSFTLGAISAGRLFVSYDAPVNSAEPPRNQTRYDKLEFTNPGVANLTAVDFFGIPFDMQTFDSSGAALGQALTYRCHTSTIVPKLLSIPGAGAAQVKTAGDQFARILSPQLSPTSYPSMAQYVQSMSGQTIAVNDAYFGNPFQTMSYAGTFGPDGSITLNGTITTPSTGNTVAGSTVHIDGSALPSAIYTGNGPYTVAGVPAHVSDNNQYSVIYRDVVAGFALGYWGGKYGNNSASWNHQPAFAAARSSAAPYTTWNEYASTIGEYSDAYGFSFHDVGPSSVTIPLDSSVATLQITIDSDQGPNTPGCVDSSTSEPPPPGPLPPGASERVDVEIKSRAAKLDRRGRALLKLTCKGDPCKGELALSDDRAKRRAKRSAKRKKRPRKPVVIGKSRFSIPEGRTQRIRVQISKKGRKLIKRSRRHRLKILAEAFVGPKSKPTTVDKRRVRLTSYKKRRQRRR